MSVEGIRVFRIADRTEFAGPAVWLHLEPTDGVALPLWNAGQYVTVQIEVGVRHVEMRSYSIATADQKLRLLVKKVDNGIVSRYFLDHAEVGSALRLYPPQGRFQIPADLSGPLVLLGAGSGIAPMLSLAATARQLGRAVYLHHAARRQSELYFYEVFRAWTGTGFRYYRYLSEEGRRLTPAVLQAAVLPALSVEPAQAVYMLCGPFAWMRAIRITLTFLGVPEERIRMEQFSAPALPEDIIEQDFAGPCQAVWRSEGGSHSFLIHVGEMVLPAAEHAGLVLPYSCRGGVCGSCRALALKGKLAMRRNEVLAPADVEQGYFLTCTALPLTPELEFILK